MSHDITATDGLVLTGAPAWHGLGRVVETAPTPREALTMAKLDWQVEQWPLSSTNGEGLRLAVSSHVLNVRSDTREQLGVVGSGWVPIQNEELADFATALAGDSGDTVKVESAASIQGGKRVWFLLRGESFSVKGFDDQVTPYILLANGHDGSLALHVRPTSVRVVCKNTLNMALGARSSCMNVRIRHEGNLSEKLVEVRRVLGLFDKQRADFVDGVNALSARSMGREDLQRFFIDVYSDAFEPVPSNPTSEAGKKKLREAQQTIGGFCREFDKESDRCGASAWAALNAVTGWIQHVDHVRGKDQRARNENRLKSNLFGTISERTDKAAKLAMQLV